MASPFFATWEMRGRYPQILEDERLGVEATKLFNDAQKMLEDWQKNDTVQAKGVYGIWPANRVGEDIEIYDPNTGELIATQYCLRQQTKKVSGQPNLSLADFVAPKGEATDYVGAFAVTAGIGLDKVVAHYEEDHDDYHSILAKAVADRLAEAFAEYLHQQLRMNYWGYAADENLSNEELIKETYKGIRPAPGYPANPDHTEKETMFALLNATSATGIGLTESLAMTPASSVSGWIFAHPESKYFGINRLSEEQVHDLAKRKGKSEEEMMKWLGYLVD